MNGLLCDLVLKYLSTSFKQLAGLNLIFLIELIFLVVITGSVSIIDNVDAWLLFQFLTFPYVITIGLPWAMIRIKSHQKVTTWSPTKKALKSAIILGVISYVVALIIQIIIELAWTVFDPQIISGGSESLFYVNLARSLIFAIVGFCFFTFIPYLQMRKQLKENNVSIPNDIIPIGLISGLVFSGVLIGGFILFKNAIIKLEFFSFFEDIHVNQSFGITADMAVIGVIFLIFLFIIYPIIRIVQLVVETFLNKKWIDEYRNNNSKTAHEIKQ